MSKRPYISPRILSANSVKTPWFPVAAAIGALAGYKAATALIEDDHTQSKSQNKLPEVRK